MNGLRASIYKSTIGIGLKVLQFLTYLSVSFVGLIISSISQSSTDRLCRSMLLVNLFQSSNSHSGETKYSSGALSLAPLFDTICANWIRRRYQYRPAMTTTAAALLSSHHHLCLHYNHINNRNSFSKLWQITLIAPS